MNRVAIRFLSSIDRLLISSRAAGCLTRRSQTSIVTKYTTHSFVRCFSSITTPVIPDEGQEVRDQLLKGLEEEHERQNESLSKLRHEASASLPNTATVAASTNTGKSQTLGILSEPTDSPVQESKQNNYTETEITVKGRDAPKPFMRFDEFNWPEEIQRFLQKKDFKSPTDIQSQGLPIALEGRDLVGIAQTGSGKTLSYVMPAVVRIQESRQQQDPFALVLGPTRELVQQIQSVAESFPSLRSVVLYGGSAKAFQISDLRRKPRLVIATPGRLMDLVNTGHVNISQIKYLVLDEADRMLDMGFEPQIRDVISHLPNERQTLMWSATWPPDVQELAEEFLNDFIQVNVGGTELCANHNIKQNVAIMHDEDKTRALIETLEGAGKGDKILIFAATKRRVDAIVSGLRRRGYRAEGTHGDKTQSQRESILRAFRTDRLQVLVATDVAARGLDVDDIKIVINYDFPNTCEDYVHRIGRTGRRDNKGTSYTFLTRENLGQAPDLIKVMEEAGQKVPADLQQLADTAIATKRGKQAFRSQYAPRGAGSGAFRQGGQQQAGRSFGRFNRHNPSREDDRTYGGGYNDRAFNYPRSNGTPSSYMEDDGDFPTGGNNRGFRSLRNDDDEFGGDQSQRVYSRRQGSSDRSGGFGGRSSGGRGGGRRDYEDDDDGTYGHDDEEFRKNRY